MGFTQFLKLGLDHIADIDGYDHILFIIVMCSVYHPKEWKKILILVTAFTLGHSLTLALAALDLINVNQHFVEFLIPVTILFTAIWNLFPKKNNYEKKQSLFSWSYLIVLLFGFIHGLGFSNYFGILLNKDDDIITPLLGFNIGVEIGQIIIVTIFMVISLLVLEIFKLKIKYWILLISYTAILFSIYLISQSDFILQFFSK